MNKCDLCEEVFDTEDMKARGGKKMDKVFHTECYRIFQDPKRYERLVKKANVQS